MALDNQLEQALSRRPEYRPDIDGLRAVAVLAVVLYHFRLGVPGGFIGVDVFFVISGFLITGVLARRSSGQPLGPYLVTFWVRRVRRLAPASIAVSVGTLIAAYLFLSDADRVHLAHSALAQLAFASNFYFFSQAGYFAPDAESLVLLHYWSLAVEEQFYLLYPPLLLFLLTRRRRSVGRWLAAALVLSLVASVALTYSAPSFNFYMLPTRAWELLVGCVLAVGFVPSIRSRWMGESLAWLGLMAILVPCFMYRSSTPFPGLAAVPPCIGTALLLHANTNRSTMVGRALASPACVWLGLISYSLYLVHWPVAALLFYTAFEEPVVGYRIAMALVSVALGWLSWKLVETPPRARRVLSKDRSLLSAYAIGMVVVGAACAVVISRNAVDESEFVAELRPAQLHSGRIPAIGAEPQPGERPEVFLWGDSHAEMFARELDAILRERGKSGYAAIGHAKVPLLEVWRGTPSKPDEALRERNREVLDVIRRDRPRHVVLAAIWSVYVEGELNTGEGKLAEANSSDTGSDSSQSAFEHGLRRTVAALTDAGSTVWIVRQVPLQRENVPRMVRQAQLGGRNLEDLGVTLEEHKKQQAHTNAAIDAVAADTPLRVLDPTPLLSLPNGHTRVTVFDVPAYLDNNHLDPRVGVPLVRSMLQQVGLKRVQ